MASILFSTLLISLLINALFFVIAFKLQTDKFTDITYSLSFIFIAFFIYSFSNKKGFQTIGIMLVIIWALRLGGFLLYRVVRNGRDSRFDGMRESFSRFAKFWLNQAIVAWALMIPASIAFSTNKSSSLNYIALLGVIVWIIGLIIESTADIQKFNFRLDPNNVNKWIDTGIWRYSRHPNYFG